VKDRAPDQTAVSISLPKDILSQIDARAGALGIPRSRYLSIIALQDISKGGPLQLETNQIDLPAEVYQFLLIAIPALAEYEQRKGKRKTAEPEPPEELADSTLWKFFMVERDEILRYKWLESQKEGKDIGINRAIHEWLQKHRALWAAAINAKK